MTANAYLDSLDIARRACIHLGLALIESIDEDSLRNHTITEVYDKLRQDELRRNTWVFAKRKVVLRAIDGDTRVLNPAAWSTDTFYQPGSIVSHTNGTIWHSTLSENQGNEPGATDAWDSYFGPRSVHLWDSGLQYYPGELVYVPYGHATAQTPPSNPGQFVVYMRRSLSSDKDDPTVGAEWDTTVEYAQDDVVSSGDIIWRSVIAINKGIIPTRAPANYDEGRTYALNDQVVALDGFIYTSVANANTGNDPLDPASSFWLNTDAPYAWEALPALQGASLAWFPLYAGLKDVSLDYLGLSLGTGPMGNGLNTKMFLLPAGFLRELRLYRQFAAPSTDRERVGDFITSMEPIILFPFCADVTNVRTMDPMFCEGLSGRIAYETCTSLTQAAGLKRDVANAYQKFMTEARIINAIEGGPEEPDEDTLISVRRMGFPWQIG